MAIPRQVDYLPTVSTAATAASPAGSYPITASGAVGANHQLCSGYVNYKPGSVDDHGNWPKQESYGAANPALTVSYSGFVNGDTQASLTTLPTVSTTATAASPAGSYPITASGAVSANYTISYVAGTLTVNKVALTITANNQSKVVGAANPALTVSYGGFVNGETQASLTTQPTVTTTAVTGSPVGTYPITASGAVAANYNISYVAGTLTVTSATLAFGPIPSKVYGAADFNPGATGGSPITYTSASPAVATIVGGNIHIVGVGTSVITATVGASSLQQTLTVTRAPLTIAANNQSRDYGSNNPTLTVSFTGFVNGETSANLTTQPTAATIATIKSRVGTYPITVSGAASANYSFTYVAGTLTVGQVPLVITVNNQSKNYGANVPFLTATYSGFMNGDTPGNITQPTITVTATAASPVGSYPITASGAVAPNYIVSYVSGTLTVNKVALTIRANNQSKIQGNPNPALTVTYTGFVNGDTQSSLTTQPTVTTTATTGSAVGSYPITASGAVSGNYNISYVSGTLTISPRTASLISVNNTNVESLVAQNEPAVRQAVSPNGDGINDVLLIDNIENYPDNRVVLMNRSGNEIFNVTGYDNVLKVFDGHSNINKAMQLPGTYFYMLEYKVNGEVKRKTGYFIIKY